MRALAALAGLALAAASAPMNISYDHRAILVNGTRRLLISGSVHYPRATPEMWPSIMRQARAGGLDMVEVYTFWNAHETAPGVFDFTERLDLVNFLRTAQSENLLVNLRIGPYVCAEWFYGGIPVFLRPSQVPGMVFRTYNAPWMQAMGNWVTYVVDYLRAFKLFADQGGPIALAQIENEYGNVEGYYGADGAKYVQWAADLATALPPQIPWIMCQQDDAPTTVINTCNGFYCDNWLASHFSSRNTPGMWTENWPGWFQSWGEAIPHRPVQDVAFAVARWFARGGTHMNYYMYFGGTNFGRTTGGPNIVTSYDYDVALDEYALPSEPKYSHSTALHAALHAASAAILNNDPPNAVPLGPANTEAHVYGTPGQANCVAFLSNIDSTNDQNVTWNGQTYFLPAWSVSILVGCRSVTFNTATITTAAAGAHGPLAARDGSRPSATARNAARAKTVSVGGSWTWSSWEEPVGVWNVSGALFHATPLEQLDTTLFASDYLWYQTKVTVPSAGSYSLYLQNALDIIYVYINGQRAIAGSSINTAPATLSLTLAAGVNTIQILSQTNGIQNYGAFLETVSRGVQGTVSLSGTNITQSSSGWLHQVGLLGEALSAFNPAAATNVTWNPSYEADLKQPLVWWKAEFPTPANTSLPFALDIGAAPAGVTKGAVWVNGQPIGRYWNILASGSCGACDYRGPFSPDKCRTGCGDLSQRFYHVPTSWLKNDGSNNELVFFEEVGATNLAAISLVQMS